jgi:hypothetical protein
MNALKQYTLGRLGPIAESAHNTTSNIIDDGGWNTAYMLYEAKEGAKALLGKKLEHNIPNSLDVAKLCSTVESFKPSKIGKAAKTTALRTLGRVTKNAIPSIQPRGPNGRFTKRNAAPTAKSRGPNGRFTKRNTQGRNSQEIRMSFNNFTRYS